MHVKSSFVAVKMLIYGKTRLLLFIYFRVLVRLTKDSLVVQIVLKKYVGKRVDDYYVHIV